MVQARREQVSLELPITAEMIAEMKAAFAAAIKNQENKQEKNGTQKKK